MKISFHGAAREVTGSCHLIETTEGRLLLDCGMIQGGKERHERNRAPFGFDPASIDQVVLSHAHIDHSGRLAVLLKRGYEGPIHATVPTCELLEIMLADSGRIQEEDARWKRKRLEAKGKDADWVTPLYTEAEGLAVCGRVLPVEFDEWQDLGKLGRVRIRMAGHILGAGIVELDLIDGGRRRRVAFSGDLGVEGSRLLSAPSEVRAPEILIMESTYGNRSRDHDTDRTELLYEVVHRTVGAGGRVVIPSFAVGRTQELLARLNDLVESGRLNGVPVYVDSPMAVSATRVFTRFPEAYSEDAQQLYCSDEPLSFPGLHLVTSVEDSKAIGATREPAVIISASGMCTAGRIKHHLKNNISNPASTVLFVGYQARGTLGSVIQSGIDPVRIFGEWYPVRASVERIAGFSAHADRDGLLDWFAALGGTPDTTFIVHGEPDAAAALSTALRERHGGEVRVPELGDEFEGV